MTTLYGLCTITLTPFHDDGRIDFESLDTLTDFYIDKGVHGMTILGIMGEAHKLTEAEKNQVMARVISQTGGRVPVIVGCSSPSTDITVELARNAERLGAAAIMVAPPSGLKNEEMLLKHYDVVANAVSIPIVLQDEPVTTGVTLTPSFIAELAEKVPSIKYVKLEEAPTTIKITKILERTDRLAIFGGLGGMYVYEELERGATGIMTGFAFPEILVETYRLFMSGNMAEARAYFYRYLPLIRFEAQLGIGGVTIRKEAFRLRGAIAGSHVRFPGSQIDHRTLEELRDLAQFLNVKL